MNKKYEKYLLSWLKKKRIHLNEKINLFSSTSLDSFGFIELLVNVEKKYKIRLKHELIFSKKKFSISDLALIIEKYENKKTKKK
ncbi:hypothetical protein N9407_00530 [Candidatus Pelagibacter sp.]|nr:hypothetical protein [Candidatus Pelagibacter sp.]